MSNNQNILPTKNPSILWALIPNIVFVFWMGLTLTVVVIKTNEKLIGVLLYIGIMIVMSITVCTLAILRALRSIATLSEK